MEKVWEKEPSEASFESHGFKCRIQRISGMGHLCGYVGVPESHAWFGKSYGDSVPPPDGLVDRPIDINKVGVINVLCASAEERDLHESCDIVLLIDVHGGLTYSEHGHGDLFGLWVFGFDCAHSGDLIPDSVVRYGICGQHDTYRDFEYVKRETESLARQLAAVAGA